MLGEYDAMATVAVKDLSAAKRFYGGTLGLKPAENEGPGVGSYKSGKSVIIVYESRYAGTNQATSVTWEVPDAEEVVKTLKEKGVTFEHYDDLPGLTRKGDLHVGGTFKGAWLKDPDGNIIHILSQ